MSNLNISEVTDRSGRFFAAKTDLNLSGSECVSASWCLCERYIDRQGRRESETPLVLSSSGYFSLLLCQTIDLIGAFL